MDFNPDARSRNFFPSTPISTLTRGAFRGFAVWALLACATLFATAAAAQSTTLISNLGQSTYSFGQTVGPGGSGTIAAQQFTTGNSAYLLTAAQIDVESVAAGFLGTGVVRVCPRGTGNFPDTSNCLASLSAPSSFGAGVKEFTASGAGVGLAANTRYFLVLTASNSGSNYTVEYTRSDSEDSGGETGWSIANESRISTNGGAYDGGIASSALKIAIKGAVASTDATLSGLSLTEGANTISLSPEFATGTTDYLAFVANSVTSATVLPTTTNSSATVEYLDENDTTITDTDGTSEGLQFSPAVGVNTVKVKVTAEDTNTTETYTVVLTRDTLGPIFSTTMTNVEQSSENPNNRGYVKDHFGSMAATTFSYSSQNFEIEELYVGDGLVLLDFVGLDDRHSILGSLFLEWAGVTLPFSAANTVSNYDDNYWWSADWTSNTINNATALNASNYETTLPLGSMQSVCIRTAAQTCPSAATSTDATLSDLELQDTSDDSAITLTPTFATGVKSYTATVANGVDEILVDPTTNDNGATVEFLNASDTEITDADSTEEGHQVALAVGANTIKVKVTAEDGVTEDTYTVVLTRAASSGSEPVFSTTMTVGESSGGVGGTGDKYLGYSDVSSATDDPYGTMVSSSFTYSSQSFTINQLWADRGLVFLQFTGNGDNQTILDDLTLEWAGAELDLGDMDLYYEADNNFYWNASETVGTTLSAANFKETLPPDSMQSVCFRTSAQTCPTSSAATNATGAPTITGAAQVGMTLTADTSGIMDGDGLATPGYTYQWMRYDLEGMTEEVSNIGTNSTYTLTAADMGKRLKVKVDFTDDSSNSETLTSEISNAVMPAATACPAADPTQYWCGTVTTGHYIDPMDNFPTDIGYKSADGVGSLSTPLTFDLEGTTYTVTDFYATGRHGLRVATNPNLPAGGAGLAVRSQRYSGELNVPLSETEFNDVENLWILEAVTNATYLQGRTLDDVSLLRLFDRSQIVQELTDIGTKVRVRLTREANTVGSVGITGTPRVGRTLTANVVDANGTVQAEAAEASHAYT